jgi:alpha-beta hydrolase superfamily lysophospholipase
MRQDLSDMVTAVEARYPGLPVFALGESMGGAVVLSALADHDPPRIAGAILVAPAVWAREDMPLSYRVVLFLAAHLVPWLKLSGQGLHIMPSDNIPMLIKLSRDPLFQHHARVDQIYGLVNLMDRARRAPQHLISPPPILYLYGAHDQIIPRKSAEDTIAALGRRASVVEFPQGYHMLLRDLDRKLVWRTILKWVDAHLSRIPAMLSTRISSALPPAEANITAPHKVVRKVGLSSTGGGQNRTVTMGKSHRPGS